MSARPSAAFAFGVAAAGIGLFSIMDAFMKSLVLGIGVYNALVWRTGVSVIFGAVAWRASGSGWPSRRALPLHVTRGAITAGMALLFFWGLARVPMAQAISLTYVAPLLALLLGAVLLHERVGARVALGSIGALVGVGVVLTGVKREATQLADDSLLGAAAILVSAVLYALNLIVARLQSQAARPGEIAFIQSAVVTTILLLGAPWHLDVPPAGDWWKIVIGAALATGSLFLLGWAYAHGEAGFLATTEYTSFVYAAVLGWAVFGEEVGAATFTGAAIIVAACLYGARRRVPARAALEPGA